MPLLLLLAIVGITLATVVAKRWQPTQQPPVSIADLLDESTRSQWLGTAVEIQGVVAADFRQPGQYDGLFLQTDDAEPGSRRGIFVRCGPYQPLELGDLVSVRGVVAARDETLELVPEPGWDSVQVEQLAQVGAVEPVEVSLQVEPLDGDAWQDVLIRIPDELVVVDTYDWARYGQVTLAAGERLFIPTNSIDPNDRDAAGNSIRGNSNVDPVRAAERRNRQRTLILDDGYTVENPRELFLAPGDGDRAESLRLGSRLTGLTGVVTKRFGKTVLLPVGQPTVTYAARPPRPDLNSPDLTIAALNVLNYFTTIDDGSNDARGADSDVELDRQRQKLTAALLALEADVLGLTELENNVEAEQDLVRALNEQLGKEIYAGVGLPDGFDNCPGGKNPIRVGFLYRQDRVRPVGSVTAIVDNAFHNARTPLVQSFQNLAGDSAFTVIVNHFKSKGAQEATGADLDQRDGQAAYNHARRQQAAAVVRYIESLPAGDEPAAVLVVGDLNAYAQEDPIDVLRAGGLVDLLQRHAGGQQPFSYVYRGQAGCLDHALATPALAARVAGAAAWHINACEPRCLDYNTEFRQRDRFRPDPFRSSDHDPVLIGLRYAEQP